MLGFGQAYHKHFYLHQKALSNHLQVKLKQISHFLTWKCLPNFPLHSSQDNAVLSTRIIENIGKAQAIQKCTSSYQKLKRPETCCKYILATNAICTCWFGVPCLFLIKVLFSPFSCPCRLQPTIICMFLKASHVLWNNTESQRKNKERSHILQIDLGKIRILSCVKKMLCFEINIRRNRDSSQTACETLLQAWIDLKRQRLQSSLSILQVSSYRAS